jgi:tetratricopeptide (TPR) repeat protein
VSIAQSFGCRVLHREWDGDFSAARNHCLDHLRSIWVLSIDADEHLSTRISKAEIRQVLGGDGSHVAFRLLLRGSAGHVPHRAYRIWLNRPDIRFRGLIHESHLPAIVRVCRETGLSVGDVDLLVEHDGYEGDQSHKHERNLPLLLAQVEEDPGFSYLWAHIGRIHAALGRTTEARSAWQKGCDAVRARSASPSDAVVYSDLINANAMENRSDPALVAEADALFPDNAAILWSGALDAQARGDFREVVGRIDRVLELGAFGLADAGISVNERMFGEWAFHLRGMARFKLGDDLGAAEDFAAAAARAPGNAEYEVKRTLAEARSARRPLQA